MTHSPSLHAPLSQTCPDPQGLSAGAESPCGSGQVCDSGACKEGECVIANDCSGGELCVANQCTPCSSSNPCGSGQVCVAGGCVSGDCATDADCSGTQACIAYQCTTAPPLVFTYGGAAPAGAVVLSAGQYQWT